MAKVQTDRFGNETQLLSLKEKISKGEIINGVYVGYLEVKGVLFKLEVSNANREFETKGKKVSGKWCKVTKMEKRRESKGW